jgi:hypothetical protein
VGNFLHDKITPYRILIYLLEVSESLNRVNNTIKSSFEQLTDDLTYQLKDGFDWVVINMNK